MSGRCTLTATCSPVAASRKRYTWPRLAAAMGFVRGVRSEKSEDASAPSSASITAMASGVGNEGTASQRWRSSARNGEGSKSGLRR